MVILGRPVVPARGEGPLTRLTRPISLWGGVDPVRGMVSDPRHPEHGRSVAGTVLVIPASIGSSSSSAIMLELMREKTTPAAIVIGEADAILGLGVIVGIELGYPAIPVVELDPAKLADIPEGALVTVDEEGRITVSGDAGA